MMQILREWPAGKLMALVTPTMGIPYGVVCAWV